VLQGEKFFLESQHVTALHTRGLKGVDALMGWVLITA
jgi:hypothetical protein